jgi:hypothetical protein
LNAGLLEANIRGSGDLNIGSAEVKRQNIVINSLGDYKAQNLASDESDVFLIISGNAAIRVRDQLRANLHSSDDLRCWGNPTVNLNKGSSGNLIHIGT